MVVFGGGGGGNSFSFLAGTNLHFTSFEVYIVNHSKQSCFS